MKFFDAFLACCCAVIAVENYDCHWYGRTALCVVLAIINVINYAKRK